MPPKIRSLANKILDNPDSISLAISKPAAGIQQRAYLAHDSQKNKTNPTSVERQRFKTCSNFRSTIKSTKELARSLRKVGLPAQDIHSELDQDAREHCSISKNKKVKILVATDILSRGIDNKGIELVINYEVPNDAEDYVPRIGRTARADRTGEAITYINGDQCRKFKAIEDLIEREVEKSQLPEGFGPAPEYNTSFRGKKGRIIKENASILEKALA